MQERKYIEEISKNKTLLIQLEINISPEKLKTDQNFDNYLLKYDAYTFQLQSEQCVKLQNIFVVGF